MTCATSPGHLDDETGALLYLQEGEPVTTVVQLPPDSARYLANNTPPHPFHLRVLLPWLCGQHLDRWRAATIVGTLLTLAGTYALAPDPRHGMAAAALLAVLPIVAFNLRNPVLVDAAALGLATTSAALWHHGMTVPAIAVALLAGAAKEPAPIFAALFAWTPWLLIGLVVPAVVYLMRKPGDDVLDEHHAWILAHPIAASRHFHSGMADAAVWLWPWGGAMLALGALSLPLVATLAAAYAQTAIATDTVRLYQWAAPVVVLAAVTAVPPTWWPLLVLVTWFNPARGDGS